MTSCKKVLFKTRFTTIFFIIISLGVFLIYTIIFIFCVYIYIVLNMNGIIFYLYHLSVLFFLCVNHVSQVLLDIEIFNIS